MSTIHFILQGKGGVGKTLISSLLAQYFLENSLPLQCLNTDTINNSFKKFKSLNVQSVDILKDQMVQQSEFDQVIEKIVNSDDHFVIDNGASSFVPIAKYITHNEIISLFNSYGKTVYFHVPITGGPAQHETLTGFNGLLTEFGDNANFMIWENRHFGEIMHDGLPLKEMSIYKKFQDRIDAVISFGERKPQFTLDFEKMAKSSLTFDEAIKSKDFFIMSKQRLTMMRRDLFVQIKSAFEPIGLGE